MGACVISRGHGRQDGRPVREVGSTSSAAEVGDEPLLIHRRTGVPVGVAANRWAAARHLCHAHPDIDVLVADDGLQHHALARDVAVLVFDAGGIGNGLLLPAGPLRQPMPAALPPGTLVLYNADRPSTPLPGHLGRRQLAGVVELAAWWRGERPSLAALHALRGRHLLAAAGLARPEGFFVMLEQAGLDIQRLPLTDHHPFDTLPWPANTPDVIVTEKDAVKLRPERFGATRAWVAALDFVPDPAFGPALLHLLAPALSHEP
ncbi:MAG: tetraacyldisaccharide 4'-kinase [Burkholderiales bacterium]|nr:tetraacyldisaccharide 4'-kinase [Burkholderiales bacterium]